MIDEATKLREELEVTWETDRYKKLQPSRPEVDENRVGL